jgi:ferredoxin
VRSARALTLFLWILAWGGAVALPCAGLAAPADPRFPQPDFRSGYSVPKPAHPAAPSPALEILDLGVLVAALAAASHLALRERSRRALFLLALFSLLYFGFYRKGCVCPVGSTQNVFLAAFDASYAVPPIAALFFFLPLSFALFFGRTFCSAVCPLGCLQDAVVVRPVPVPPAVAHALGMVPYAYLATALLFASTGAGFVICRYDPFVSFFRLGGSASLLAFGGFLLLAGLFVARPYCRFLCPYGVLLRWASLFSRRHSTITPDRCVQCRLCEGSCPFGAILPPPPGAGEGRESRRRTMSSLLLLLPFLAVAGGLLGYRMRGALSAVHPTVALADRLLREEAGLEKGGDAATDAFRQTERPLSDLLAEAGILRDRFGTGGALAGAFLGVSFGGKLIAISRRRRNTEYVPDRAACLSCGRCFDSCPVEQIRRHGTPEDYDRLRETLATRGGQEALRSGLASGTLLEVIRGERANG